MQTTEFIEKISLNDCNYNQAQPLLKSMDIVSFSSEDLSYHDIEENSITCFPEGKQSISHNDLTKPEDLDTFSSCSEENVELSDTETLYYSTQLSELQNQSHDKIAINSNKSVVTEASKIIENELLLIKDHYTSIFEFNLPRSNLESLDNIDLDRLTLPPNSNECEGLARDNSGNRINLNQEQLKTLRRSGRVHIRSKNFKDQEHIWQISKILQKGTDNIKKSFFDNIAAVYNQICIMIPGRIYKGKLITIKNSLENILGGTSGLLNLLIGLRKMQNKHSESDIENKMNEYCLDKLISNMVTSGYTTDILSKKSEILRKLEEPIKKFSVDWNLKTIERREAIYDKKLSENGNIEMILNKEKNLYQTEIFQIVRDHLDKIDADLLVNLMKNLIVYESNMNKHKFKRQIALNEYKRLFDRKYRIRSKVPKFIDQKEQEFLKRWDNENPIEDVYNKISNEITGQEKILFDKNNEIRNSNEYKNIRNRLVDEKIPIKIFEWDFRIWCPSKWIIERGKQSFPDIIDNSGTGPIISVKKWKTFKTSTRYPFWRLYNIMARAANYFMNMNYYCLKNLLYGDFGIRSLFGLDKFYSDVDINRTTGKLEPISETITWFGRVSNLWRSIKKSRDDFEKTKDTGILGRTFTRILNIIWNYGVKGIIGTVICFIGHPIMVILNTCLSSGAVILSPILAPTISIWKYLFDILIFDTDLESRENFFLTIILGKFLIKGFGQMGLAILGVAAHGIFGVVLSLWSLMSNGCRSVYDTTIYHLILKHQAKVPSEDGFLVKRIQGPGLSNEYYYLIDYDLALSLLEYELEKMEIDAYVIQKRNEISEPNNKLMEYYRQFLRYGLKPDPTLNPINKFYNTKVILNNRLDNIVGEHRMRHKIQNKLNNVDKIKMTKNNLKIALKYGTELCKNFVEKKILPRLTPDEQNKFWNSINVIPNSWNDLCVHCYSKIFNKTITIPIEDWDPNGFHIEIKNENTRVFIKNLFNGNLDDGSDIILYFDVIYNLPKITDRFMTPDKVLNNNLIRMMIIDKSMINEHEREKSFDKFKEDPLRDVIIG